MILYLKMWIKWRQEETEYLSSSIYLRKIQRICERICGNLTKETPSPDDFTDGLYQIFTEVRAQSYSNSSRIEKNR